LTAQTIRPTTPVYSQFALAAGVIALAVVAVGLLKYPEHLPVILAATAAVVVTAAICVALFFRNTRITLEPGRVSHTNMLGHTKRIAAASVSSAVLVHHFVVLVSLRTRTRTSDSQVFLLDQSGAPLLRVRDGVWGADAIPAVRAAMAGVPEVEHETMDAGTMSAAHPRAVGFFETNPLVVGVLAGIAIVAVAAAAVVAGMVSGS
jgi:hypothetical protein